LRGGTTKQPHAFKASAQSVLLAVAALRSQ